MDELEQASCHHQNENIEPVTSQASFLLQATKLNETMARYPKRRKNAFNKRDFGKSSRTPYMPGFYKELDDDGENEFLYSSSYDESMSSMSSSKQDAWSPQLSQTLHEHCGGRKSESASSHGSSSKRMRTPRTLTRIMQLHRDNERHRHHGLNASIREITKCIPGYEECGNDTKIGKLQRIIHYICHLEEHIQVLCEQVGLDLEFKHLFLSPHMPKEADNKRCNVRSQPSSVHSVSSTVCSNTPQLPPFKRSRATGHSRQRMKISSPTIDSTTDDRAHSLMVEDLDSASTLSAVSDNDEDFSENQIVFVGSESDPFTVTSEMDDMLTFGDTAFSEIKERNSENATPPPLRNFDWLNAGVVGDAFLSPETVSFLTSKLEEDQDLKGTFTKLYSDDPGEMPAPITSSLANGNKKVDENVMTMHSYAKTPPKRNYITDHTIKAEPSMDPEPQCLIPDEAVPPLFDIEVYTERAEHDENNNIFNVEPRESSDGFNMHGLSYFKAAKESSEVCYHKFDMPGIKDEYDPMGFSNLSENPEFVHIVPHLQGVDASDDEEMASGKPPDSSIRNDHFIAVKVEPIEQLDADDMFASRLQNIEEDCNVYEDVKPFDEFHTSPENCSWITDGIERCHSPLFTNSRLLTEAGLSPQAYKAGIMSPLSSPIQTPTFQRQFQQFLSKIAPKQESDKSLEQLDGTTSISPITVTSDESLQSFCHSIDSQGGSSCFDGSYSSRDESLLNNTSASMKESGCDDTIEGRVDIGTSNHVIYDQGCAWRSVCDDTSGDTWDPSAVSSVSEIELAASELRLDHRKTSWMNGFMMYSRINRKKYIKENPGVHTSQISKMMGQDWRGLPQDDKQSYRDQAKQYTAMYLMPRSTSADH